MIHFLRTDANHPDFMALVTLLNRELRERYGEAQAFYDQFNQLNTIPMALVAYSENQAIGCGALRPLEAENALEIKRMYVLPEQRGKGIAAQILLELEHWALDSGMKRCILETGNKQPEAIRLYEKSGYRRIPNFGQYAGDESSVCFEKILKDY